MRCLVLTGQGDRAFSAGADIAGFAPDIAASPETAWRNFVTRGQLAKIVVIGAGFTVNNPPTPTFRDVARTNVFYPFIETAVCHHIVDGYNDGTFRPNNFALRSQIAKIVYLAVLNRNDTCAIPLR